MAKIRECEYKKYSIIINLKLWLYFRKNNTKMNEEEINGLEMWEIS